MAAGNPDLPRQVPGSLSHWARYPRRDALWAGRVGGEGEGSQILYQSTRNRSMTVQSSSMPRPGPDGTSTYPSTICIVGTTSEVVSGEFSIGHSIICSIGWLARR